MKKRKRHKHQFTRLAQQHQQPRAPTPPPAPSLNLDYMNASTVLFRDYDRAQIILAGCGGIGAYMAQHIGRLMYVLYRSGKACNLTLVDPDVVKEENIGRQLFCDAEIGMPKAVALARRYGYAWGLNNMAFVGEYSENLLLPQTSLIILVGCVDNAAARVALHNTLQFNPQESTEHERPTIWWLDCGNLKDTGRVMLGSACETEQLAGAFIDKKRCVALPSPALQYPSLLIPGRDEVGDREMSCAEMQLANLQSLNINAAIAAQGADFLTRMMLTGDLKRYQCEENLASGSVKSFYCTPEAIAREIDAPVDFVKAEVASEVAA